MLFAHFPSFSEGLSLRPLRGNRVALRVLHGFPFLFGGTFIEARVLARPVHYLSDFPSFSEGLSLRLHRRHLLRRQIRISLPFRRDFH